MYSITSQRIVSVVPSQTELLFSLGLNEEIAGITKFCRYPVDQVKGKPVIGGTKTLNLDKIYQLRPSLILANKEENTRSQIEELQQHYPVHVTDVNTLAEALAMIRYVGALVGKSGEAETIAQRVETSFHPYPTAQRQRVAYFIWRKPYMVAGNDTFIHAMLEVAGFRNAFADQSRYPEVIPDAIRSAQPDLIFLSSEPYSFGEKHRIELETICPSARVMLVDGEVFSWYGSRLLHASEYFRNLHQEIARQRS